MKLGEEMFYLDLTRFAYKIKSWTWLSKILIKLTRVKLWVRVGNFKRNFKMTNLILELKWVKESPGFLNFFFEVLEWLKEAIGEKKGWSWVFKLKKNQVFASDYKMCFVLQSFLLTVLLISWWWDLLVLLCIVQS